MRKLSTKQQGNTKYDFDSFVHIPYFVVVDR